MAGKAGEPGALAEDRPRRDEQRLLRPLAEPLVAERGHRQAAEPRRSPLVQRPPEGRRAAGQVARGVADDRSGSSPGFTVELVAQRAAGEGPDRLRLGRRRQALGRRDGRLSRSGPTARGSPAASSGILEDTDGDGRYDKSTTFLDGLGFPTGVMPWRNGVLVACAPDIFYAEDRDGDGKADHREVLFTGFGEGNQQHRVNGFELGLDGWVYGANGDSGGTVRSIKTGKIGRHQRPRLPVPARHRRVRGRERPDPVRPAPRRLGPTGSATTIPTGAGTTSSPIRTCGATRIMPPPTPGTRSSPRRGSIPISRTLARFNDLAQANHVTSANSPTPYRDELFGPWFATSLFVSEPVHNLVHRMVLEPDGVDLPRPSRAERGGQRVPRLERQLVPADDAQDRPRRRPLDRRHVPRRHRASRVDPRRLGEAARPPRRQRAGADLPRLPGRQEAAADPAARSARRGGTRRRARQPQRLAARHGPAAAAASRRHDGDSRRCATLVAQTKRPQTRVQAIWTLADLGGLDEASALAGLNDADPRVREAVVEAVEPLLRSSSPVAEAVLRLADDPEARVRFRVALLLGNWDDHRAGEALARLARRDGQDPWMRAAILSSAVPHVPTLLAGLLGGDDGGAAAARDRRAAAGAGRRAAGRARARPRPGRSAGRRGRGGATPPGSSPRSPGLLAARERARTPLSIDLDRPFAGALGVGPAAGRGRLGRRGRAARGRLAAAATRPRATPAIATGSPACSGRGSRSRSSRRPSPAWADLERPEDRRPAARRLEGLLAADPRRDPRHAPEPPRVDRRRSSRPWKPAGSRPARSTRRVGSGSSSRRDPALRARAEAVFAQQAQPRQGGRRCLPAGARTQGRSGRRRGGLQEAVRLVPPAGQRRRRGRSRPRHAQRQVARVAPDRHPRPEPGVRVEVRRLHGRDRRRPRPERPDRQRVGHVRDPPPPGRQGRRAAPLRDRGDGGLGPVADARRAREGPETPRPRRPDRLHRARTGRRARASEPPCPSRPISDRSRSSCTSCRSRPGCR